MTDIYLQGIYLYSCCSVAWEKQRGGCLLITHHIFFILGPGIGFLEFTAQAHSEADLNMLHWISPWKRWMDMNGMDVLIDARSDLY